MYAVALAITLIGADVAPMPKEVLPPYALNGVDQTKLDSGYKINGKDATREQVYAAFAAASIPDYSRKRRITIIGDTEQRKEALAAIGNPDWAIINAYPREHWYVKQGGFVATGNPTVYVTDADGTVVHRQDDAKELKVAMNKADPNYSPALDPDLRKAPLIVPKPDVPPDAPIIAPITPGVPAWLSHLIGIAIGVVLPYVKKWLSSNSAKQLAMQAEIDTLKKALTEKRP